MTTYPAIKSLIKVRYFIAGDELSSREYTYYSTEPLKVGDIIVVPVRDTTCKARVSTVDVPESEIASFKDKVKIIPAGTSEEVKAPVAEVPEKPVAILPKSTALTITNPSQDPAYTALGAQALNLSQYAQQRIITCAEDAAAATNDINIIRQLQKQAEDSLRSYIKPFTDYVAEVRAAFKLITDSLDAAYNINRAKSTVFLMEAARKQKEAEELNRQQEELTRRMAAAKGMVATDAGVVDPSTGEVVVPAEKLVVPAEIKRVHSETGNMGLMKIRKYRVIDFSLLPDQYKIENSALLNKVTKAGIPAIPGVELYLEEVMRVTSKKYK